MSKYIQKIGLLVFTLGITFIMNGCSTKSESFNLDNKDLIKVKVGSVDNNSTDKSSMIENHDTSSSSNYDNNSTLTKGNDGENSNTNSSLDADQNDNITGNDGENSNTNSSLDKNPLVTKVEKIQKNEDQVKYAKPLITPKEKKVIKKDEAKDPQNKDKKEEAESIKPKIFVIKASEFFL